MSGGAAVAPAGVRRQSRKGSVVQDLKRQLARFADVSFNTSREGEEVPRLRDILWEQARHSVSIGLHSLPSQIVGSALILLFAFMTKYFLDNKNVLPNGLYPMNIILAISILPAGLVHFSTLSVCKSSRKKLCFSFFLVCAFYGPSAACMLLIRENAPLYVVAFLTSTLIGLSNAAVNAAVHAGTGTPPLVIFLMAVSLQFTCCVLFFYSWVSFQKLSWLNELLILGVAYPTFAFLMGRIIWGDLFRFIMSSYLLADPVDLSLHFSCLARQIFHFSGFVFIMLTNANSTFFLALLVNNGIELLVVYLGYRFVESPKIQSMVETLSRYRPASSSTGKRAQESSASQESSATVIKGNKGFIKTWLRQLFEAKDAKVVLMHFGEEFSEKVNVIPAICGAFASAVILQNRTISAKDLAVRSASLLFIEFVEDFLKKMMLLRLTGANISKFSPKSIKSHIRVLSALLPVLMFSVYLGCSLHIASRD